jgi:hypothetical protein
VLLHAWLPCYGPVRDILTISLSVGSASFENPTHLAYDEDRHVILVSDKAALRALDLEKQQVTTLFSIAQTGAELNDIAVRGNLMAISVPGKHMVLLILIGCDDGYVCQCTSAYGDSVCMSQGKVSHLEHTLVLMCPIFSNRPIQQPESLQTFRHTS